MSVSGHAHRAARCEGMLTKHTCAHEPKLHSIIDVSLQVRHYTVVQWIRQSPPLTIAFIADANG